MPDTVGRRRQATEAALVRAATELFVRDGFARTTLASVADRAGVAERTLYVRFATKVDLFQRVIEAAVVGDTDRTPLPEREWSIRAMSAATLDARIAAFADGVADMHERLGPLMAVNGEVEPSEPAVQSSAGAAREATMVFLRAFWESAAEARLTPPETDLEWLIATSATLSAAETRLLVSRTLDWDRDEFRDWLAVSMHRLLAGSTR
ncbi:TetR/AcrR family transcriptional regulator [Microbacterium oxydans]|uniref:TetR/AcrR family transcriptional regulator n=1 Tax=Microbacterium oxydans TaxID=82380 RepID=UPI00073426DC|nr:TetR/AcrR family transcriptional regulator [Microbacterium oxydans]